MQNFVPAFIEQQRKAGKTTGKLNGTVLFVDVSGFTNLTEVAFKLGDAGAELMSRELTRIFDPMVNAVHQRGGFIGGFAGDVALIAGATGGVYLAGGILPRWGALFDRAAFRARFVAKGTHRTLMEAMPVKLIVDPLATFHGLLTLFDAA